MARFAANAIVATLCLFLVSAVQGQSFGPELRNTMMPASGGMGGASMALPQDLQSAIHGNPATLAQFRGTQFSFSGSWIEPTFNFQQMGGSLPGVGDFAAKSQAQGSALGNIGVTQDYRALGLPVTIGMGLISSSGAGLNLRQVPESNGTTALIQVLATTLGAGANLTDRVAVGGTIVLGSAVLDAPFVGIGAGTTDYGLRGSVGITYELTRRTMLGLTYISKKHFNFDDAISLELPNGSYATVLDVDMDMPPMIGLAIADQSLFCGKLLVAADVLYFDWDSAALFGPIFDNQWALQVGLQYNLTDRIRLRAGYVLADRATQAVVGDSAGGITPPVAQEALRYLQAQFPNVNQHRFTFGFGIRDLLPGMDMDMFAGGMPRAREQYGEFTSVNLESYWIGFGMTWRFGRGSCCQLPVADDWRCGCRQDSCGSCSGCGPCTL